MDGIMAFGTQCAVFGERKANRYYGEFGGPPKSEITRTVLESLMGEDLIVKILSVSESAVYRKMKDFNLSKSEFTDFIRWGPRYRSPVLNKRISKL